MILRHAATVRAPRSSQCHPHLRRSIFPQRFEGRECRRNANLTAPRVRLLMPLPNPHDITRIACLVTGQSRFQICDLPLLLLPGSWCIMLSACDPSYGRLRFFGPSRLHHPP